MSIQLLSRTDDFGSARAANRAILEAADTGYVVLYSLCPLYRRGGRAAKEVYPH